MQVTEKKKERRNLGKKNKSRNSEEKNDDWQLFFLNVMRRMKMRDFNMPLTMMNKEEKQIKKK